MKHCRFLTFPLLFIFPACSGPDAHFCRDFGIDELYLCDTDSLEVISLELAKIPAGINVNDILSEVDSYDSDGNPLPAGTLGIKLLMMRGKGSREPSIERYRLLLEAGFHLKHQTFSGVSTLHWCVSSTSGNATTECVTFLLDSGAPIDLPDHFGQTPLLAAIFGSGRKETKANHVPLLIARGADVNLSDNRGQSPLAVASQNHQVENVRILLEAGANVNHQDSIDGSTALLKVLESGGGLLARNEVINLLVEAGADVNATRKDGNTVLSLASKYNKDPGVIQLLVNAGAKR